MTDIFANVRGRRSAPRLYPIEPLIEAAREPSECALIHKLSVGGSTWAVAKAEGLTEAQADTWAVRCGFHPSSIWPHEWFAYAPAWTPDDIEQEHAA